MKDEIGVVMVQEGSAVKKWVCPFCGNSKFTSIFERKAPMCSACVSRGKVYTWEEKKDFYEVRQIFT